MGKRASSRNRTTETSSQEVFDSDGENAHAQAVQLQQTLQSLGKYEQSGQHARLELKESHARIPPRIQIVWERSGTMLRLEPYTEGTGLEAGVFGYDGT